ncbi:hypothetical protein A3A05_00545 [Candidatus Nomurabacteria bacterium RIFCSPLOWO2_01_FULL_41_12]|uniref:Uncharacterized protein n=1 Tax=Candidatus Nomurabacteria bacterium RIFCSPLOWO2_01_FULL_41_12 TaxID=1801774 RepID=A0A1F6WWH8_9BACT|nr:MAG: hypothetical protein A2732_00335 [Candidatus Nomurabacteria bacterium RIFCSPHIGHO2_01_FULL_40_10]OGI86241.1 MAG: hypothetical protein A3A05_00545 [Candidatus Nomurabacteria bacterium RIFCSPLOWO2_01_FULL_41_12]
MEPEKKSNGALVGLAIIIIILVVGGLYIWQSQEMPEAPIQENITTEDSSELDTLEADLQMTDTQTGVDVDAVN